MFYKKSLAQSLSRIDEYKEDCVDIVLDWASRLRREGLRISISEILDALTVLENYALLKGSQSCSALGDEDIEAVINATMVKGRLKAKPFTVSNRGRQRDRRHIVGEAIERIVREDLEALGTYFGRAVHRPRSRNREKYHAYLRLKILGLIEQGRKGERITSTRKALATIHRIAEGSSSVEEAYTKSLVRALKNGANTSSLIDWEFVSKGPFLDLEEMDLPSLVTLMRNTRDSKLAVKAQEAARNKFSNSKSFSDILEESARLSISDLSFLAEKGVLTPEILSVMIDRDPRLVSSVAKKGLSPPLRKVLANAIRMVRSRETLTYLASRPRVLRLIDKDLLSEINGRMREGNDDISRVMDRVAAALRTGNPGYLDIALSENSGYGDTGVEEVIRPFYELIETGSITAENWDQLAKRIYQLNPSTSLEIVMLMYARSRDAFFKRRVLRLATMLLQRKWRQGARPGRVFKYYTTSHRGRLDLYRSLRNIVGLRREVAVYARKTGVRRIVLVLDKSGSMKPYALNVLLAAASIAPFIEKLVIFDDKATVYDMRRSVSKRDFVKVIDLLLSTEFYGYTDIVTAMEKAASSGSRKIVVVSDLRQTVVHEDTVYEAFSSLAKRGYRIYVLAPPSLDVHVAKTLEEAGIKVFLVREEKDVERVLRLLA